jgi:hypothetical protein
MTTAEAWELVDAGLIRGEWRRWVSVSDKCEFDWHDVDSRREALLQAAKHVAARLAAAN